jgi:hypothetical protein
MRRLFTTAASGLTIDALRWGERKGRWRRVERGVYAEGPAPVTDVDRGRARVMVSGVAARGANAGVLHGLDGVTFELRTPRREPLPSSRIVEIGGVECADALQTLVDLALALDDDRWEQALESALRKKLVTIVELEAVPPRTKGRARITRVLATRPVGAPPTESLLETLALQLSRVAGLGEPVRQHEVWDGDQLIARVDLAWPADGFFFELDGQHHKDQPVYDARRETAVVAATGMLPGRFTWHEVTRIPRSTARRMSALRDAASARGRGAAA